MVTDTHVHLQDAAYDRDRAAVLDRAADAGVEFAIAPGTDLTDSQTALRLAEGSQDGPCRIYAAIGIHPTNAHLLTPQGFKQLRHLADSPHVVAVGEIGLDYYWPKITNRGWHCASPEVQRAALESQLQLASELDLPVIIHDRDAHDDILRILSKWRATDSGARGTLHAYAAGPQRLQEVLNLGFYIGMDGPVTFKKATALHSVARLVRLDRLLIETDGPYLTPVPHRGKRNEPAYVTYIAARIAELRGVSTQAIIETTTANARRCFDLPELPSEG